MTLKLLFVLTALLSTAGIATAQTVTIDNTEYRQKVLKYLASDFFITEGLGLQKVYIGQSEEQMIASLGKPLSKKRQRTFSSIVIYTYQLDKQTALQVGLKKDRVHTIAIAGVLSSQYTTVKGARFGMPVHEIINYYGSTPYKDNKLLYRSQGIRFDFKNNKLAVIRIFPKQ